MSHEDYNSPYWDQQLFNLANSRRRSRKAKAKDKGKAEWDTVLLITSNIVMIIVFFLDIIHSLL